MHSSTRLLGLWALPTLFFLSLVAAGCAAKRTGNANLEPTINGGQRANGSSSSDRNPILLEEEYEAEQRGEIPTFDIPVERNAKVEQWLVYFQGRGRKWYHLWLERSGRYIPLMKKILRENDLPEDLVYLAMIESGFSPNAFSRARAAGVWQFMKSTGRLYGLKVDFWRDQRKDPEKATIAAAKHLKDLYDQFQSWKLAAAAYNAGPAKVSRAIRKYNTEDFWALTKGHYLRAETRNYVPKLIAAALIAKEPAKYGFTDIQFEQPLAYDKIILKEPVNLMILCEKAGYDLDELMSLNPELNHPVTPPDEQNYELRVPAGTSEKFLQAYNGLGDDERFHYTAHLVRRGDTLARISRLYAIPPVEIMKANNLTSSRRLRVGRTLLIPVPLGVKLASNLDRAQREEELEARSRRVALRNARRARLQSLRNRAPMVASAADGKSGPRIHIVQEGESLWEIAQIYGCSVGKIKNANNLRRSRVYPGTKLTIPST